MNEENPTAGNQPQITDQPTPVFLRMPVGHKRELWPGSRLKYDTLRSLVAPGWWNNNQPPIRAYKLCKIGKDRGVVLIEHADVIAWHNQELRKQNPGCPLIPLPNTQPPPTLTVPASGAQCPYTQLRHTVLYQLAVRNSPYGPTRILFMSLLFPGRTQGPIAMTGQSVFDFIRSLPPPRYEINPGSFSGPNPKS